MDGKEFFALLNSCLNAVSTVLLIAAYVQIRRKNWRRHGYLIGAALVVSSAFLACYLYSNATYGSRSLDVIGELPAWVKYSYWIFLAVHVIAAIVMLPLIAAALWQIYKKRWERHKVYSRPAYWIWLYVSVTGVMIYVLLYHALPAMVVSPGSPPA
ncbi:MAG: DUF420 domain-containing protein [Planctomycetota bacterium]